MKLAYMLFLIPAAALAQTPSASVLAHGLDIFNKTCATGYCHGVRGTEAGAPRLANRGFDEAYISNTIRNGIHGTGMPAFGDMERPDLMALVAYVGSLNGITPSTSAGPALPPARPKLSPEAQRGRELFSDQVRGLTRCSVCHQADGLGIAVTLPLTTIPENVAALRQVPTPHLETAVAEGDTFPALVLNRNGAQVKLYDITTPPPVLRTFSKAAVTFKPGTGFRHETMLSPYKDSELESILTFLKAVTVH